MKRFVNTLALTASAFGILIIGAFSQIAAAQTVQLSKDEVKEFSAAAATPADHLRLATYFNNEADRFDAEAAEHDALANLHRTRTNPIAEKHAMSGNTAGHCDYFAKSARAKAKVNRELAAHHELMAIDAGK
jgi:hypothetical protein